MDVIDERDSARFELNITFGRLSYITEIRDPNTLRRNCQIHDRDMNESKLLIDNVNMGIDTNLWV